MNDFCKLSTLKKKLLSDQDVRKAYDELSFEDQVVRALIDQRIKRNVSQKQLANQQSLDWNPVTQTPLSNLFPKLLQH